MVCRQCSSGPEFLPPAALRPSSSLPYCFLPAGCRRFVRRRPSVATLLLGWQRADWRRLFSLSLPGGHAYPVFGTILPGQGRRQAVVSLTLGLVTLEPAPAPVSGQPAPRRMAGGRQRRSAGPNALLGPAIVALAFARGGQIEASLREGLALYWLHGVRARCLSRRWLVFSAAGPGAPVPLPGPAQLVLFPWRRRTGLLIGVALAVVIAWTLHQAFVAPLALAGVSAALGRARQRARPGLLREDRAPAYSLTSSRNIFSSYSQWRALNLKLRRALSFSRGLPRQTMIKSLAGWTRSCLASPADAIIAQAVMILAFSRPNGADIAISLREGLVLFSAAGAENRRRSRRWLWFSAAGLSFIFLCLALPNWFIFSSAGAPVWIGVVLAAIISGLLHQAFVVPLVLAGVSASLLLETRGKIPAGRSVWPGSASLQSIAVPSGSWRGADRATASRRSS